MQKRKTRDRSNLADSRTAAIPLSKPKAIVVDRRYRCKRETVFLIIVFPRHRYQLITFVDLFLLYIKVDILMCTVT